MPLTDDELKAIADRVLNIGLHSRIADNDAAREVFFAHAERDVLRLMEEIHRLRSEVQRIENKLNQLEERQFKRPRFWA